MTALHSADRALAARYESDARGRLRCSRPPAAGAAPRFVLVRTPLGNLWRLREDLAPALVRRLALLAAREAGLPRGAIHARAIAEPERAVFLERALAEEAPIEARFAGAVLAATGARPSGAPSGARVCEPDDREQNRLAEALAAAGEGEGNPVHEVADGPPRGRGEAPWAGSALVRVALSGGRPVAAAWCSHGDGRGPSLVRVVTLAGECGHGHGTAVGRAVCEAVHRRGGEPYASVPWHDLAGLALSRRLGLEPIGDERSWR